MQEIKKYLNTYEEMKEDINNQILNIIRSKVSKINPDIIIENYLSDIGRIYVRYNKFNFEFNFYYHNDELIIRGYGKTNGYAYRYDRYSIEEQKKREKSYDYVRNIIKKCLE